MYDVYSVAFLSDVMQIKSNFIRKVHRSSL